MANMQGTAMLNPDGLIKRGFADFPNQFRRDLADEGFQIIEPDGATFPSFSLHNWFMDSFLARKGERIYVPLVHARKPQHGAFSKLVHDIEVNAGLEMAVIAPLGSMVAILGNWLYEPRRELICGSVEDVWYAQPR
jgi:hypothetical protein